MSNIKVIEVNSGELLKEFAIEEQDEAYQYATQMEQMGLDVKVQSPSLPETLADSLGSNKEEIEEMGREIEDEISSHITCCDLS
jgi:uncharacterized cupredoxin-like copper-binding protein